MDIVYIRELEVRTIIGIFDWEREQRQVVSLDLEMGSDIGAAAATDTIENALDYKAVAKRLIDFIEKLAFLQSSNNLVISSFLLYFLSNLPSNLYLCFTTVNLPDVSKYS